MIDLPECPQHEKVPAGFRCLGECGKPICGACTAIVVNQPVCVACGGPAQQVTTARADRSFAYWMFRAVIYPFTKGAIAMAVVVVLLAGIGFFAKQLDDGSHGFDGIALAAKGLVLLLYAVIVVDSSARGGVSERGQLVRLARELAGIAILWVPAAAYVYFVGAPHKALDVALFGALAGIYVPMALAVCTTDISFGDATSPFHVFAIAWAFGAHYLRTFVAFLVVAAIAVAAAQTKVTSQTPGVGELLAVLPFVVVMTTALHIVGLLPFVHGFRIRWGTEELYRDPVLPRQKPTGSRKHASVLTTEALTKVSRAASTPLDAAIPEGERGDARKIAELIKDENMARALRTYESRPVWTAGAFTARNLLLLAKQAQRTRPELALTLFQKLVSEYPDTEQAKTAQKALDGK